MDIGTDVQKATEEVVLGLRSLQPRLMMRLAGGLALN
jgi:hypothetical protein